MIKIAIVEDEALYAQQLQGFLHQYEKENGELFDITVYKYFFFFFLTFF